jgi:hypothetical protein
MVSLALMKNLSYEKPPLLDRRPSSALYSASNLSDTCATSSFSVRSADERTGADPMESHSKFLIFLI